MRVVAVVLTHHLPEEAIPWMSDARRVFDDLFILIDEQRVTDGTFDRAQRSGARVLRNKGDSWYDPGRFSQLSETKSDWVFLLDYDEELSPEWHQGHWRQLLESTSYTHFWCQRRWIVSKGTYLIGNPWGSDFQLRLFRNNLPGTTFATELHDHVFVPGPSACLRTLAVHHHVLWLISRSQREEKVRAYERLRPGSSSGYYYLFEDYDPPQAPLPRSENVDITREVVRMERLSTNQASKVSLKVTNVLPLVRPSQLFWIAGDLTNGTSEFLYSAPPSFPVHLSYHWLDSVTRQVIVWDGYRSGLGSGVEPNSSARVTLMTVAPEKPGRYVLQTTLVQENAFWFEKIIPDIVQEFPVLVLASSQNS